METESALSTYHIFNTVAEAGNLSKAAKMLYISQPAISRAVSKLEQNLSVKLFIRNSRGVRLTEEGKLLYEHTKTAFDSLRQGEESLRRITMLGISELHISVDTTLCKYILMPYLQSFIRQYPHIQVTVQCCTTDETLKALEEKATDIGLIVNTPGVRNLEFCQVSELEPVFVASESYLKNLTIREQKKNDRTEAPVSKNRRPTAQKISDSTLAFIKRGTFLLPGEAQSRSFVENYLSSNHIETGQVLNVSTTELLIDFAKIGLGIGCVAKEFIQKELEERTLTELPLSLKKQSFEIGFVYNKTSLQSTSVNKFIDFCKGDIR